MMVADSPMYDFSVLRQLRKRENLTIGDVSARSDVSPAVISKLERNQSQAGLETLFKLGRVFGITASELLALAESRTAMRTRATHYRSGDFSFRRIDFANVDCYHGLAQRGERVIRPEIHHDDYEICWILNGTVRVTLPKERYDLAAGEALQFDAVLEHAYEALSDCELIILHLRKDKRF